MHVGRIDHHFFLLQFLRLEGHFFQQPLHDRKEPARTDVFRSIVDLDGNGRNGVNAFPCKVERDVFGFHQGLILFHQGIPGFRQDAHQVAFGQGFQLNPNGKPALQLGNQISRLGHVKRSGGNKQDMVGLHRPVFRIDGRSFDNRQQIPLHAFP